MTTQEEIQQLIDRSICNDPKAFGALVTMFQPLVFKLAFRLLCNENEAKDMVQDTFVKIWLSLDKYNNSFRFSTWVYRIACNVCYDRLRTMHYSSVGHLADKEFAYLNILSDDDVEQTLSNNDLKNLILRFTEELTPKQKLVFTLRDIEGLEVSEVEAITGMSAEKIKSNLYQARKQIRIKINQIDSQK